MTVYNPGDTFQITKPTECCNNTQAIGEIHIALGVITLDTTCNICHKTLGELQYIKFINRDTKKLTAVPANICINYNTNSET